MDKRELFHKLSHLLPTAIIIQKLIDSNDDSKNIYYRLIYDTVLKCFVVEQYDEIIKSLAELLNDNKITEIGNQIKQDLSAIKNTKIYRLSLNETLVKINDSIMDLFKRRE